MTKAKLEAVRVDLVDAAGARAEAGKAAKEEFESSFFQGYADLKRRVTIDHPEWDLAAYLGEDSEFWEVESPIAEDEAPVDEAARAASVSAEAQLAREVEIEVVVVDPPA